MSGRSLNPKPVGILSAQITNKAKNMNKKLLLPIIIIVVLLAGGVFAWFQFMRPAEEAAQNADWQTYRNEEWGFEIRHPGNVRPEVAPNIQDDPRFSVKFTDNTIRYFTVTIFGGEEDMEGHVRLYAIENTERKILIDNVEGSQFYVDNMEEGAPDILNALVRNRDRLYVFTSFRGQEELFNQMLGTFRFIERDETAPTLTPSPRRGELTREIALALLNLPTECRAEGIPGKYRSCSVEITKPEDVVTTPNVVVIFDGQYDDSVRATKIEASFWFSGRGDHWVRSGQVVTTYKCQPGRGQQEFAAALCL